MKKTIAIESEKIAKLARVFSEDARVRIIDFLKHQESTTNDIATRLGIPQPRISSHLGVLLKYGMVSVSKKGRQRIYHVHSSTVSRILDDFSLLSSVTGRVEGPKSRRAGPAPRPNPAIRQCRTCYDHLAGVAGVELLRKMLGMGWLSESKIRERTRGESSKTLYELSQAGLTALKERGVDVDGAVKKTSRVFAYGCQDWTEREPHLAGSLGGAVLSSILSSETAKRVKGTRALKQLKPISSWARGERHNLSYDRHFTRRKSEELRDQNANPSLK